jgi:hypothetical protein
MANLLFATRESDSLRSENPGMSQPSRGLVLIAGEKQIQHVLTAAGLNLVRVATWLAGTPLARTRQSAFVRLMAHPA